MNWHKFGNGFNEKCTQSGFERMIFCAEEKVSRGVTDACIDAGGVLSGFLGGVVLRR